MMMKSSSKRPVARTARTLVIRANAALAAPWLEPLVARIRVTLAFVAEGDERPEELR
jgi:hypothetical protein